jgi:hypothetical protein
MWDTKWKSCLSCHWLSRRSWWLCKVQWGSFDNVIFWVDLMFFRPWTLWKIELKSLWCSFGKCTVLSGQAMKAWGRGWSGVEVHLLMAKGPLVSIQWVWAGPSTSLDVLEKRKVSCSCWVWNYPSLDSTFVFLLRDLSCWCWWPSIHIESCKLSF